MPYIIRDGNYIWYNEVKGIIEERLIGPTVALAFDRQEGKLLKHGMPRSILIWLEAVRRFMMKSEIRLVGSLTLIEGTFPVNEINKCIQNFGYISVFYRSISPIARRKKLSTTGKEEAT
jgi:hypothetical protein